MKNNFEIKVEEMNLAFGHPVNAKLTGDQMRLRSSLIEEEANELIQELCTASEVLNEGKELPKELQANIMKELCDLIIVATGLSVNCEFLYNKLDTCFNDVHKSNMSKLGKNGEAVYREDGKLLKGPNYQPPNLIKYFE